MNIKKFIIKWAIIPFLLIMNAPTLGEAESFIDIAPGEAHFVAISYLKDHEIIDGYDDNSYRPWEKINRAEALKMITVASGVYSEDKITDEILNSEPFSDTPPSEWYTKYLTLAKEGGIIDGYDDGTFLPDQSINLAESLKILFNCYETVMTLEYPNIEDYLFDDVEPSSWYAKYTALAGQRDMLVVPLSNKINPDQKMTRGYLAEIIYRMLMRDQGYDFGKATFYGAAVQGSGTASGETFDMNEYTAAHRDLPFGTIVEVTNLSNGKSINVRITDRGPYGAGRVLDLTSGAFAQIGTLSSGVMDIQYRVISE